MGVTVANTRHTRADGILLEVNSAEGANTLAEKVKATIVGKVRVSHPERTLLSSS